ncbi:MAG: CBS domain-containing protein, partial [Pelagibacterales bacterium]|nr:CBS domain-containing protein [Pelagibacterales bacterium]
MKTIRSSSVLFFTKNIKDFIKDDYITANNDDEINSVIKRVQQNNKSTIIVVENKKITGIITEQDIARRIVGVV